MDKYTQHDGFTLEYTGDERGWRVGSNPIDRSTAVFHLGRSIVEAAERAASPASFDVDPSAKSRVALHGLGGY